MHLIKLTFIICTVAATSRNFTFNEVKLTDYLIKILTYSFQTKNYISYVSNGCFLSTFVEAAMRASNIAATVLPYEAINAKTINFDGYIVVSDHFRSLSDIFTGDFPFKPHQRILIFYNWEENFFVEPFNTASEVMGLDIMVVQAFKFNITQKILSQHEDNDVQIMHLRTEKVVSQLTQRKGKLKREDFLAKKWRPKLLSSLTASAFNCTPFVIINDNNEVVEGVEFRIVKEISAINKWNLRFNVIDYNETISSYKEVLNAISTNAADVGMCSQWVSVVTKSGLQVTDAYSQFCVTFLVPKPELLPDITFVFQPLQTSLWVLLISTTLIVALAIFAITKAKAKQFEFSLSILEIIRMATLGSIKNFPPVSAPKTAARFILTAWIVNSVLVSTGYSAGFASSLTSPRYANPVNTIEDMVEAKVKWGGPDCSNKEALAESPNEHIQKLLKNYKIETSIAQRNALIKNGKYAVFVNVLPRGYVTETESLDQYGKTHLKVLKECVANNYIVFVLRKNSPYAKIFNEYINKFKEHGLIIHWDRIFRYKYHLSYMSNFHTTYSHNFGDNSPITIKKIQGAFYLLLAGLIFATIAFVLEHLHKKYEM